MRRVLPVVILLLCAVPALGQQTPVSATVVDPNGSAYTFSTGYASIACPGNQQPTFNGSPLTRTITISGFDGFGSFHMVLWDVNAIQPTGCGWQFMITWKDQITSFTTGIIGKSNQSPAITGSANVDLSAAISAFAPPLPIAPGGGAILGPAVSRTANYTAVRTDNGKLEIFNGVSLTFTLPNPPPSPTWIIGVKNINSIPLSISANGLTIDGNSSESLNQGSSVTIFTDGTNYFTSPGNIAAATPVLNAFYASPSCPNPTPANCFQVFDDGQFAKNAVYTSGGSTVTTAASDPAFVSTDAAKISYAGGNCNGIQNCFYDVPQGTITTVNSAHSVTVSTTAVRNSLAGADVNFFIWGHDDGSTLQSVFSTMTSTFFKRTLLLPCGIMLTSLPPFIVPPNSLSGGGIQGCGSAASTIIVPLPKMNCNNSTGGKGCLFSNSTLVVNGTGQNLPNWRVAYITFVSFFEQHDAAATYNNPTYGIVTSQNDELDGVWVFNWNWQATTPVYGMWSNGSYWTNSGSSGGGSRSCLMNGTFLIPAVMQGGFCANGSDVPLTIQNDVVGGFTHNIAETEGIFIGTPLTSAGILDNSLSTGIYFSHGDLIGCTLNNPGGVVYISQSVITQLGCGQQMLQISGGSVHLSGVQLIGTGTVINQSGGTVYDDCGNSFLGTGTVGTFTGGNFVGTCSLGQVVTNSAVASRNTSISTTQLLPTVRFPGPFLTIQIYGYDSAAGSGCTGNTTITWTISYTDPTGTTQTSTATETITTNGGSTGGDAMKVTMPINVNPNTVVNYSTTYTVGTGCSTGPSYAANLKVS